MSAISFSVGAIFEIEDRATGTLEALATQFRELGSIVDTAKAKLAEFGRGEGIFGGLRAGIDGLKEAIVSIGPMAEQAGAAMRGALNETGAAADAASAQIRGVGAAFADAQRAGAAYAAAGGGGMGQALIGGAVGGGMGGGIGGGGPGAALGGGGRGLVPVGPGGPGTLGGGGGPIPLAPIGAGATGGAAAGGRGGHTMLGLAGLFAGYEAYKQAMEEDFNQRQTVATLGFDPDSPAGQNAESRLRGMLTETTRGTIFTEAEAAKALREIRPVLGLTGDEGVTRAEGIFPGALRLGELSHMRGKGQLGQEAVAGGEFAHLEQRFDPAEVEHSLDIVNRIAKATDSSIQRQMSIAKYALPIGLAAGIDPDRTIAELGVAEQSFGPTSTAGTGYAQFVLGALKTKGGTPAHLAGSAKTAEREFEHSLRLEGEDVGKVHKEIRGSAHDQALRGLGITDQGGKLLDVTTSGGLDVDRIKQQIADYALHHDRQDTLNTLTNAFGVRGERYAERYAEPGYIARERQQIGTLTSGQTVRQEQATLAQAPLQRFEQMLANVSNIGNTLATATLPGVNAALQTFNTGLLGINDFLKGHPVATEAIGYGAEVGAGALALRYGKGALRWLWHLGEGGSALADGVAGGGAAAAGGVPIAGLGLLGGAAWGISSLGDWLTGKVEDLAFGPGSAEKDRQMREQGDRKFWHMFGIGSAQGAEIPLTNTDKASPRAQQPDRQAPAAPVMAGPVTVGPVNITINGVPDESGYRQIIARLTDSLRHAMEAATGPGHGTTLSPYTGGGGMP